MQNVGVSSLPTLLPIAVASWFASQTTGVLYRQSDACQMESVYQGWCGIVNKAFEKIGFKDVICVKMNSRRMTHCSMQTALTV